MRERCARNDFRNALPGMLHGEDPDFVSYIRGLVRETATRQDRRVSP